MDDFESSLDLGEWSNEVGAEIPEGYPIPDLWRVLIMPRRPKAQSAGGIVIPASAQRNEMHVNYIGQVVALGPLAYKSEIFQGLIDPPKPGDWVAYGQHAGQPMVFKGTRFLVCNDKEILCRLPSPDGFLVYAARG